MNNAFQLILECPKCRAEISVQRRSPKLAPAEELACLCGWRGAALKAKLRHILPFNWVYSSVDRPAKPITVD
jgi:hypothetical protein